MMSVSRSFTQLDSAMIGMTIPTNNAALNLHTFDITGLLLKGNKRASKPEATVTGFRSSDRSVTSLETYASLPEADLVVRRSSIPGEPLQIRSQDWPRTQSWGKSLIPFRRVATGKLKKRTNFFAANWPD